MSSGKSANHEADSLGTKGHMPTPNAKVVSERQPENNLSHNACRDRDMLDLIVRLNCLAGDWTSPVWEPQPRPPIGRPAAPHNIWWTVRHHFATRRNQGAHMQPTHRDAMLSPPHPAIRGTPHTCPPPFTPVRQAPRVIPHPYYGELTHPEDTTTGDW